MLREALVAAALLSMPAFAQAQAPGKLPRVGILANTIPLGELTSGTTTHPAPRAVIDGLRALGWVDGQNVRFIWRSAEGDFSRLPALADELLREPVDVFVAYGPGVGPVIRKTETVPIVMATSGVTGKLTVDGKVRIDSFARPGGNITGLTLSIGAELNGKRLEFLKQAAPRAVRVAFLSHEDEGRDRFGPFTKAAAQRLGLTLHAFGFGKGASGLEGAFAEMARQRMDAVVVAELPITNLAATQAIIHRLAELHRLPVVHEVLNAADSGGLMAYGHDINKLYKRAPYFIDRILRGSKPGDIPIEQPGDFELRVNLRAAKAIGLALPQTLLVQAERVIE